MHGSEQLDITRRVEWSERRLKDKDDMGVREGGSRVDSGCEQHSGKQYIT